MVDLNLTPRLEAISKLAKKAGAKLSLENGEIVRWTKGDKPTEEAIQSEIDAVAYARNREVEYPTIQELVVALYDTDDKSAIEAKRAEVKKKYPKPE